MCEVSLLHSLPYSPAAQRNSTSAVVFENRRYQVLKPCKEQIGLREFVRVRFVQSRAVVRVFFIGRCNSSLVWLKAIWNAGEEGGQGSRSDRVAARP